MKTSLRSFGIFVGVALLFLLVSGCGKKEIKIVPVGEMEDYRDPVLGFHFSHPKGWIPDIEAGRRARFFSGEGVKERFLDPTGQYADGAGISLEITATDNPDSVRKSIVDGLRSIGFVLQQPQTINLDGKEWTKVPYLANFGNKIIIHGERIYCSADSLLYEFTCAGFGDLYASHRAVFDASLKTFEFPKPIPKGTDPTLPSETMTSYEGKAFTFMYPENFNFTNPPKGTNEIVVEIRGVRQDCAIRFDVFPAKGLTADKVYQQNIGRFKPTATGKATIAGETAPHFTYQATKDVERRFYFMVKNDKVYRINMDWYKPQRDQYLAAYEKVLASFKLK